MKSKSGVGRTGRVQEEVEPRSAVEWRDWLENASKRTRGVWLVLEKGGKARLSYEDAVEEAIAHGWIDSKPNKLDDARYKLWLAPRKAGSAWSNLNKARASRLIREGRMTKAGMDAVTSAKADGSWTVLNPVQAHEVPRDLANALGNDPKARDFFQAFPPSSKRIILEWIADAKRPETRSRRVDETVRLAARNLRAHHWRQPKKG